MKKNGLMLRRKWGSDKKIKKYSAELATQGRSTQIQQTQLDKKQVKKGFTSGLRQYLERKNISTSSGI